MSSTLKKRWISSAVLAVFLISSVPSGEKILFQNCLSPSTSLNNTARVVQRLKQIEKNLHPLLGLPATKLLKQIEASRGDLSKLGPSFWNEVEKVEREYERITTAPGGWAYQRYPELQNTEGKGTVLSLTADLMLEHPELMGLGTGGLGVLKRDDTFPFGEIFGDENYFLCAPFYSRKSHQVMDASGKQHWVFEDVNKKEAPLDDIVTEQKEKPIRVLYGVRRKNHKGEWDFPPTQRWIYMKVWRGKMGKGNLLLLDTDIPENDGIPLKKVGSKKTTNMIGEEITVPVFEKLSAHIQRVLGTPADLYAENDQVERLLQEFVRREPLMGRYTDPLRALKFLLRNEKNDFLFNPAKDRQIMERIYPFDAKGTPDQRQRYKQFVLLSMGSFEAFRLVNQKRGIEVPTFLHLNDPHTAPAMAKVLADPKYKNVFAVYGNHTIAAGAGQQFFHEDSAEREYHPYSDPMWFLPYSDNPEVEKVFRTPDGVEFSQGAERIAAKIGIVHAVNNAEHKEVLARRKADLFEKDANLRGVDNGVAPEWAAEELRVPWEGLSLEEFKAHVKNLTARLTPEEMIRFKREAKLKLNQFLKANEAVYGKEKTINPDQPLFVFSKRFTPYKRAGMVLDIVDEIVRKHPFKDGEEIQIIFSGKANDKDGSGAEQVKRVYNYAHEHEGKKRSIRVIYIPDYHIELAQHLLAASDFWLNVPERKLEASGTSLLKAAMNGSILISTQSGAAMNESFFEHGVNALLVDVDGRKADAQGNKIKTHYWGPVIHSSVAEDANKDYARWIQEVEMKQLIDFFLQAHELYYRPENRQRFFEMRREAVGRAAEMSSYRQAIDQVERTYLPLLLLREYRIRHRWAGDPKQEGTPFEVEVNLGNADPAKVKVGLRYWDTSLPAESNWKTQPDSAKHRFKEWVLTDYRPVPDKPGRYLFSGNPAFHPGKVMYVSFLENHFPDPTLSIYRPEFKNDPWIQPFHKDKWWSHGFNDWDSVEIPPRPDYSIVEGHYGLYTHSKGVRFEAEVYIGNLNPNEVKVGVWYWDTSLPEDSIWDQQDADKHKHNEFLLNHPMPVPGKPGHYVFSGAGFQPGRIQYVLFLETPFPVLDGDREQDPRKLRRIWSHTPGQKIIGVMPSLPHLGSDQYRTLRSLEASI